MIVRGLAKIVVAEIRNKKVIKSKALIKSIPKIHRLLVMVIWGVRELVSTEVFVVLRG